MPFYSLHAYNYVPVLKLGDLSFILVGSSTIDHLPRISWDGKCLINRYFLLNILPIKKFVINK